MRLLTKLRLRLRSLVLPRRVDAELDEEMRVHIERQIDAYVAGGMTPAAARDAARREMGGVEHWKDQCRDARGFATFESLRQDVRYALRMLRRNPGFTLVGVLVMSLGIGANTAVFSVVNAVLLNPLAYPDPDRIVTLSYSGGAAPLSQSAATFAGQVSAPDATDWQEQSTTFEAMAYYTIGRTSVMANGAAEYRADQRRPPGFLPRVRRRARARPDVLARRAEPGRQRRDHHLVVRAATIRRPHSRPGADSADRRSTGPDRRRDARRVRRPRSRRPLAAAGRSPHGPSPREQLPRHRTVEGREHAEPGADGDLRHCRASHEGVSRRRHRRQPQRRGHAASSIDGGRHAADAPADAGRGRSRAAHRLRQHGDAAAGESDGAHRGDGRAHGHRRQSRPHHSSTAGRRAGAGAPRRRHCADRGGLGDAGAGRAGAR